MTEGDGIVYIVRHGEQRLYKIGKASVGLMKHRLANLQVGNPIKLTLIGSVTHNNALLLEGRVHALLIKHRVSGEWFNCSLDDIYRAIGKAVTSVPDYDVQKCMGHLNGVANGTINVTESTRGGGDEGCSSESSDDRQEFGDTPRRISCVGRLGRSEELVVRLRSRGSAHRASVSAVATTTPRGIAEATSCAQVEESDQKRARVY